MPDGAPLPTSTVAAPDVLADALVRVQRDGERVTLLRDGRPVAVLAPMDEAAWDAWETEQDEAALRDAQAAWERGERSTVTLKEIAARDCLTVSDLLKQPE